MIPSPEGAAENQQWMPLSSLPGLGLFLRFLPAVETAGYFRSPLCGFK